VLEIDGGNSKGYRLDQPDRRGFAARVSTAWESPRRVRCCAFRSAQSLATGVAARRRSSPCRAVVAPVFMRC
jgi:hypothetical protein